MDSFGREQQQPRRGFSFGFTSIVVIVIAVLAAFLALTTITWSDTGNAQIGLHYKGGIFQDKTFAGVIPPGQSIRPVGLMDSVYYLPANQRTYQTGRNPSSDSSVITATNADGNEIEFETSMTFELPTNAATLDEFYREVCTKYQKCAGAGWSQMLDDYLRKAQETVLQSVSRGLTSEKMTQDQDALITMGQEVSKKLPEQINDLMGGPYLEVKEYQINNLHPPESVIKKYEQLTAAQVETQKADQQAKTAGKLQKTLKDNPQYLQLLDRQNQQACIESGDCRVLYVPQGSDLLVQQP